MSVLFHRPSGTGASYLGPGDIYTWLVTGEESDGQYFAMYAVVPPNGGPAPHIHTRENETFYVLDGTPSFWMEDHWVDAKPGDFVNIPMGMLHCFHNFSDRPMTMILTFTPSGIEKWFEECLERVYDLSLPIPDNIDEVNGRFAAFGGRYGIELFLEMETPRSS